MGSSICLEKGGLGILEASQVAHVGLGRGQKLWGVGVYRGPWQG